MATDLEREKGEYMSRKVRSVERTNRKWEKEIGQKIGAWHYEGVWLSLIR